MRRLAAAAQRRGDEQRGGGARLSGTGAVTALDGAVDADRGGAAVAPPLCGGA